MKTLWTIYIVALVAGLGCIIWGITSNRWRWTILGSILYVFAGALSFGLDWLHERWVLWRYTRWD